MKVKWRRLTDCGLGQVFVESANSEGTAGSAHCVKASEAQTGQVLGLKEQSGLLWGTACYTPDTGASSITSQQDDLDSLEMKIKKTGFLHVRR